MADFRVIGNDLWRQPRASSNALYCIGVYIYDFILVSSSKVSFIILLCYILSRRCRIIIIYYDIMWKNIEIRSIIDYFPFALKFPQIIFFRPFIV